MSESSCPGDSSKCHLHFHDEDDSKYLTKTTPTSPEDNLVMDRSMTSAGSVAETGAREARNTHNPSDENELVFQKIIRNFTPSWFIITMSTGALSIALHQTPYHSHWLKIISTIFFVLNLVSFLLFTLISALRYLIHPEFFPAVLHYGHQSLFLATFPVGTGNTD